MRKNLKPPGRCIFCNRLAGSVDPDTGKTITLSKQHLWPEWMQKLFPNSDDTHQQMRTHLRPMPGNEIHVQPLLTTKQGDIKTWKLRLICERHCNNGWISRTEAAAKEFLVPLIQGKDFLLTPERKQIIALWISIVTIMWEFTDIKTMSIAAEDRNYLYKERKPPDSWSMCIGCYKGTQWNTRYRHHASVVMERNLASPANIIRPSKGNYQTSSLQIGFLFMHISSCIVPDICQRERQLSVPGLHSLWPINGSNISWPGNLILNDSAVNVIADRIIINSFDSLKGINW